MVNRVLLEYWGELKTMLHHPTLLINHITDQSWSIGCCWSIEVSWRLCYIIQHCLYTTWQINHCQNGSVEVLRWVEDYVASSNIAYLSHYRSIILTRVLLKYWGELKTMLHHATLPICHITDQSFSPGCCWSIEVSWRLCCIIQHCLSTTSQINHCQNGSDEVLSWVEDYVASSNIAYLLHYRSIILTRVLFKYWGELKTMLHHPTLLIKHITYQSWSRGCCWSIEVSWRLCCIIQHCLSTTLQINHGQEGAV